jgi:hypothetical protein
MLAKKLKETPKYSYCSPIEVWEKINCSVSFPCIPSLSGSVIKWQPETHKDLLLSASSEFRKINPELWMKTASLYIRQFKPLSAAFVKKITIFISCVLERYCLHCIDENHRQFCITWGEMRLSNIKRVHFEKYQLENCSQLRQTI